MPKSYPMGHYQPAPAHGVSAQPAPSDQAPVAEAAPTPANVFTVDGIAMQADTLEDIERIGIERGYTVDMVKRFKLAYWQSRGEDAWVLALDKSLRQYNIDLLSLIREPEMAQYGAQLPEDLAYHTALRMGRIASPDIHGQERQWVSMGDVSPVAWAPRRTPRPSTAWYPYSVPETPFPSLTPRGTDEPQ